MNSSRCDLRRRSPGGWNGFGGAQVSGRFYRPTTASQYLNTYLPIIFSSAVKATPILLTNVFRD
jgi:hypothetical protein